MEKIVYYVATSLDGFIAGLDEDSNDFKAAGEGVDQYLADIKKFKTVIMGRRTYEFGYKFGLMPGQPAYPHMQHHIFSRSLRFENQNERIHVHEPDIKIVEQLKKTSETDIYLCGGGVFAGWLLENEMIDVLKIKLNPLILGDGIPLFGTSKKSLQLSLTESKTYDDGLTISTYKILY
jgi:dihydrofolate reductase